MFSKLAAADLLYVGNGLIDHLIPSLDITFTLPVVNNTLTISATIKQQPPYTINNSLTTSHSQYNKETFSKTSY